MPILKDFDVLEISLVQSGAVQEEFLALKQKNGGKTMPDKSLVEKLAEEKKIADEKAAAEKVEADKLAAEKVEADKLAAEAAAKETGEVAKTKQTLEMITKEKDGLVAEVKKYKDAEKVTVFKTKAGELKNINAESIELHTILMEADEKFSEPVKKNFEQLLKTVNGLVESSSMFTEIGKSAVDTGEIMSFEKLEKTAEIYAKEHKITKEKAIATLVAENPAMYEAINKK